MRQRSWSVLATMLLASTILAAGGPASAATPPIGKWLLKGNLTNAAGTSLKLRTIGAPAFGTVTLDSGSRTALNIMQGDGLELNDLKIAARKTYTIEVMFEFEGLDGYQRILSFGPADRDPGLYLYNGRLALYDHKKTAGPVTLVNQWTVVRVTRDGATGQMVMYVDGVRYLVFKDAANEYLLRKGTVQFFEDDGAEEPIGAVGRVVFWNKVVPLNTTGHD